MISRKQRRLGILVAALASLWALVGATGAGATTITVGSVLPATFTPTKFERVQTFFNTALPEAGVKLVSPVNGAIVRWRIQGAKGGPFSLRVLRPNGSGGFSAAGTSNPVTPASTELQTFAANVPVKAGDLIGIDPTNASDEIGVATVAGASFSSIFPTPLEGATQAPSPPETGKEIELAAEVQPAPAVKSLSTTIGPLTGGTRVKITGTDLNGASSVEFGEVPATSFTVESETQITAVAPPSAKRGPFDVTVKTLAGKSETVREDRFGYAGCTVPNLTGKTFKLAKRALANNECRLGKVKKLKGATATNSKVVGQGPRKGKILAKGAKVKVTLKAKPVKQTPQE